MKIDSKKIRIRDWQLEDVPIAVDVEKIHEFSLHHKKNPEQPKLFGKP